MTVDSSVPRLLVVTDNQTLVVGLTLRGTWDVETDPKAVQTSIDAIVIDDDGSDRMFDARALGERHGALRVVVITDREVDVDADEIVRRPYRFDDLLDAIERTPERSIPEAETPETPGPEPVAREPDLEAEEGDAQEALGTRDSEATTESRSEPRGLRRLLPFGREAAGVEPAPVTPAPTTERAEEPEAGAQVAESGLELSAEAVPRGSTTDETTHPAPEEIPQRPPFVARTSPKGTASQRRRRRVHPPVAVPTSGSAPPEGGLAAEVSEARRAVVRLTRLIDRLPVLASVNRVAEVLLDEVMDALPASLAVLYQLDGTQYRVLTSRGLTPGERRTTVPSDHPLVAEVVRSGGVLLVGGRGQAAVAGWAGSRTQAYILVPATPGAPPGVLVGIGGEDFAPELLDVAGEIAAEGASGLALALSLQELSERIDRARE